MSTIPTDNSASATISALVVDSNNVAISGVAVQFSASAGTLAVTSGTTGANGTATATLTASSAAAGTNITVTATVGTVSGKTTVGVVAAQTTITLETTSPQMPSSGSQPATITALVRGASNQLLSGATVNFSASSGGIGPGAGVTDSNGSVQATLSTAGDPTNRTIAVTATSGAASATVNVSVVGTTLTLTGPTSLVSSSQGTFTAVLADSSGAGIPGKAVTLKSQSGNTISPSSATTDNTGTATFTVTATKAGADTLTATSLGLTATAPMTVSSQSFMFTAPANNTDVDISTSQNVTITWTNNGTPVSGQNVTFSSTRGNFPPCTTTGGVTTCTGTTETVATDASGVATAAVFSTSSGPGLVTATATGVSANLTLNFIATTPSQISVQASPAVIPISGQSTVTVILRDANNNLVANKTVDFQLSDPTGGTLSVGSAVTNAAGTAQTVYTASTTASGADGVVVTASVPGAGALTGNPSADITVGGQSVFLSLGTGNTISQLPAGCGTTGTLCTQFEIQYSVQAVDAAGNPVDGATINFTVLPVLPIADAAQYYAFGTGFWIWSASAASWVQENGTAPHVASGINGCFNNDPNNTGVGSGTLYPGNIATVSPGSVTTSNGGTATVSVIYPQNYAQWVQETLTATTTVNGTQSTASSTFWLPMLASDLTQESVAPPGVTSPYGNSGCPGTTGNFPPY
ncbi:MAG TPA: Ig-like domain-containing protein [Steroidobacteraceae bacterium]|nr:Ig-like domain-containing protein [Steroidobacteraceae bacterium]